MSHFLTLFLHCFYCQILSAGTASAAYTGGSVQITTGLSTATTSGALYVQVCVIFHFSRILDVRFVACLLLFVSCSE